MDWDRLTDIALVVVIFALYVGGISAWFFSEKAVDFGQLSEEEGEALIAAAQKTFDTGAYEMTPLASALAKLSPASVPAGRQLRREGQVIELAARRARAPASSVHRMRLPRFVRHRLWR